MASNTLTYSELVDGWASFYSYYPDWMIGMNQYLYTFKGGDIWRHSTNEVRNNFYGVQYNTRISGVFNESPLENKIFKIISTESDGAWTADMNTDIQDLGRIDKEWFKKKEGAWFAFIRNNGPKNENTNETQWELRSLNGIARSLSIAGTGTAPEVNFAMFIDIGTKLSVGDAMYFLEDPYTTPQYAGIVASTSVNKKLGVNKVTIDSTVPGIVAIPIADLYWMYIQDPIAESHGILGHYLEYTLTNDSTVATEMIAVKSEVMKSYP
jgi:hypothetical protein